MEPESQPPEILLQCRISPEAVATVVIRGEVTRQAARQLIHLLAIQFDLHAIEAASARESTPATDGREG